MSSCPIFNRISPKERGEIVEKNKICWSCFNWLYKGKDCMFKDRKKCDMNTGGVSCNGVHHTLLHDSGVAYYHIKKHLLKIRIHCLKFSTSAQLV